MNKKKALIIFFVQTLERRSGNIDVYVFSLIRSHPKCNNLKNKAYAFFGRQSAPGKQQVGAACQIHSYIGLELF